MSLTGDEIKALLEKAKQFENIGSNDLLKAALGIYGKIIEAAPEPYYYVQRSIVKYRLHEAAANLIDSAVSDISKAIELDPDRGDYYRLRGDYQFYKLAKTSPPYNVQPLMQLIEDYRSSISKSPTEAAAWLSLISVHIITEDFDEAISLYGQCAYYADTNADKLGRSLLGCIALIMAGDKVEDDDLGNLNNEGEELNFIAPYITGVIPYLNLVKKTNQQKWTEIARILRLYIRHYDSSRLKNIMLDRTQLREIEDVLLLEKMSQRLNKTKAREQPKTKKTWISAAAFLAILASIIFSNFNNTSYNPSYTYKPAYSFSFDDIDIPISTFSLPTFKPMPTVSIPPMPSFFDYLNSEEPSPTAASQNLEILYVISPVAPDGYASVSIKGRPGVEYDISVMYYSGESKASGLKPKTADDNGIVLWMWHVGPNTKAGNWKITISGGGEEISTYFTVTED